MPILHKLDISNNIIDEFGISFFYLFPNYLKNLKKLFIKGNHLSSIQELEQKTNILYKLKNIIIIN
jgi:Leucine-rich repeat (LRR) protein